MSNYLKNKTNKTWVRLAVLGAALILVSPASNAQLGAAPRPTIEKAKEPTLDETNEWLMGKLNYTNADGPPAQFVQIDSDCTVTQISFSSGSSPASIDAYRFNLKDVDVIEGAALRLKVDYHYVDTWVYKSNPAWYGIFFTEDGRLAKNREQTLSFFSPLLTRQRKVAFHLPHLNEVNNLPKVGEYLHSNEGIVLSDDSFGSSISLRPKESEDKSLGLRIENAFNYAVKLCRKKYSAEEEKQRAQQPKEVF